MGSYASIGDYYAFRGEVEPDLDAAATLKLNADLARASNAVRAAIRLATYQRDTDGLPAVAAQRQALIDATAAQHDAIVAAGAGATGVEPVYDQVSAIGVQFSRRSGSRSASWSPADSLSDEAGRILLNAGFYTTAVRH